MTPTLATVLAQRRTPDPGPTVELGPALDHREAKARALAVLAGGDPLIATRQALDTLAQRNAELLDADSDAIRAALADQVALLEAVVTRYTMESTTARNTEQRRALASVALRASQTLNATLIALHRVTEDQRNGAAIPA